MPKDNITFLDPSGFWWKGHVNSLRINKKNLGEVSLDLDLFGLLSNKIRFKVSQTNILLSSSGYLSKSFHYWELEDVKFKLDLTESVLRSSIYSSEGYIKKLIFNNKGCLEAEGRLTAKVSDIFGLFSKELLLTSNLTCRDYSLYGNFQTKDEGVLTGYFAINVDSYYKMEAYSKELDTKLSKLGKQKIHLQPSIKFEGNLNDLISSFGL